MQIVGLVISWTVAIGIIGIGIGYVAKSEMNATGFGLPQLASITAIDFGLNGLPRSFRKPCAANSVAIARKLRATSRHPEARDPRRSGC